MALCWDSCTVVKARCAFNEPMFVFSTSIVLSLLILARSCCLSAEAYYWFCLLFYYFVSLAAARFGCFCFAYSLYRVARGFL